jgi:NADH:ubiquinone oxidoreductase subunit F (NADH-binding)
LIDEVTAAGLRGRGGAGFPTARKLAAVAAARGRPVVVANGCEGEPASTKDAALLTVAPHLVLDGGVLAAHALGAAEVILCVHHGAPAARTLPSVIAERDDPVPVRLVEVPARYVASEASALVHYLTTGDARPTTTPPRASQRGVNGAPTLVDNVETLAHLALIARFGASWFRSAGTPELPGTLLVTVGGAIRRPGVYEVAGGTTLDAALRCAGGPAVPVQAVLIGGYAGNWLAIPESLGAPLSHEGLRSAGSALGVAVLLALPHTACGLAQTAHLLRYLATESAKQCGPCTFGLPAIATDLTQLVAGHPNAPTVLERLHHRLGVIPGRGACAHPDGAARLTASALHVFKADLHHHIHGHPCPSANHPPLFPIPGRH